MGLIIPATGEQEFLDRIVNGSYTVRLYSNDVVTGLTLAELDALTSGDFTEATFPGYAASALVGGAWVVSGSNPAMAIYPQVSFTRSTSGALDTVYGFYVTRDSDGEVRWFEQAPSVITIATGGDSIVVTPVLTLDDNGGSAVLIGEIAAWPTGAAPAGYLLCDGSAVSRTTYAALFAVVGTTYGVGDGSTTFNLPNMKPHSWEHQEWQSFAATPVNFPGTPIGVRYFVSGGFCTYQGSIRVDGAPTGNMGFDLPVPSLDTSLPAYAQMVSAQDQTGVTRYIGTIKFTSATTVQITEIDPGAGSGIWTATNPFTWVSNDFLWWQISYPVAETTGVGHYIIRAV